jgi:regulatory protein
MHGTITALRLQKRTADRVNVYLDGEFAFGLPALAAARLRIGQQLDEAQVESLRAANTETLAYERAVRFLGYRPRSLVEVRRHLADVGESDDVIAAVLARLQGQGYLDDAEFARYWVRNREQFRPRGPQALRQELRQHGLAAAEIDAALAEIDPESSAYEAGRPRALRLTALAQSDPQAFRRKLSNFLLRRGFDFSTVRAAVNRLLTEQNGIIPDVSPDD